MMQTMRNSAKIVFFLVLVAFAGFMILQGLTSIFSDPTGAGKTAPPGVIGEIDGTPIPLTYFENAYRPRFRDLLQENEDPSEEQLQQIRDEIWNNLTTVTLLENEAARRGVSVTNAEIVEYMKLSPPQEFQGLQEFKTNNVFDIQKYQDWLRQAAASNDPQIIELLNGFENRVRQQLTLTRLQEFVISMVRISPGEVKSDYMEKNEKVKVRYFFISNTDFKDSTMDAPEQELRAKYETDKEKYKEGDRASFSFVQFPKKPGDVDFEAARGPIDSIRAELLAGADFAEIARKRSEDPGSAPRGGDLDWFGQGKMVEPFWEATTKLKNIGDISEPVKTPFGWHLIKLTGKQEAKSDTSSAGTNYEYRASHILLKVEASPQTTAALEEQANQFLRSAASDGFKKAADDYGLLITESGLFTEDGYIPALGQQPELAKFAFESKSRDVSKVVQTRNGLVVGGLAEQAPARMPAFEDVKDRVKESYLYEKRIDEAYKRAMQISNEFAKGKSFDVAAAEAGKQVQATEFFARHEFIPRVGSDPYFIGAAFNLSKEQPFSKGIRARAGAYLIEFVDRQEPDTAFYVARADSLVQAALTEKRKNIWPKFVNGLRTSAKITDYRSYYYGG